MIGPAQHSLQTLPIMVSEGTHALHCPHLVYSAGFAAAMLDALTQIHSIAFINLRLGHHKVFSALSEHEWGRRRGKEGLE